jgi:hypothetical protein
MGWNSALVRPTAILKQAINFAEILFLSPSQEMPYRLFEACTCLTESPLKSGVQSRIVAIEAAKEG